MKPHPTQNFQGNGFSGVGDRMEMLVSREWLSAHLDDPDLVVIDCTNFAVWSEAAGAYRTISGHSHRADEHIDGSCHADFTAPGYTGDAAQFRNTLPAAQDFADAVARLGVREKTRVVLYDDAASLWACRVWWMLRWIGFDHAAVLDGGWQNWDANDGRFPQDRAAPAIVYCGSGVAAASVAFTMIRLGFEDVAINMPGLQEWIMDQPVAHESGKRPASCATLD